MPELTIVIPAFREEENLRILLPRLQEVLRSDCIAASICVVDTMMPLDNTEQVCKNFDVQFIRRRGGNSYGDAVRSGIAASKTPFTLFMDGDGSHTPEFIPRLWQHRSDYDVVIGSRYVEGGDTENMRHLILMSRIVNIIYSAVLSLKCKDASNSFKLYKTSQLQTIQLKSNNFDIVEEILFKLTRKHQVSIKEVPFTFKKRMFGDSKRNLVLFILTYLVTLLILRFRK